MNSISQQMAEALAKAGVVSDVQRDIGLYLSTGVNNFDYALSGKYTGGGIKSGRITEWAGPPSSGKTLAAQHVMKEAQKAGGMAAFHDHERSFMPHLFQSFGGDISPGIFTLRKPRSFEESIDQAVDWMTTIRKTGLIPFEAPLVVVFDSLHSMVPAANLERQKGEAQNMREKLALAQATASELPALAQLAEENNTLVIFLNHLKTKPGVVYGDPRYTPGGEAIDFYSSVRVFLSRRMEKDKTTKETTGQIITAEVIKNKTYPPFKKAEWIFRFKNDVGYIDVVDTMIGHLIERKLLNVSGAYIEWEGKKYYRSQLVEHLNADPEASVARLVEIAEAAHA
jgi:recombination protein RecA